MDFNTEHVDIKLLRMMMQTFYEVVQLTSQLKDLMQARGAYCINQGFHYNTLNTIIHLLKVFKCSNILINMKMTIIYTSYIFYLLNQQNIFRCEADTNIGYIKYT